MTEADANCTAEWWEARSSRELNELIQRGLSAGRLFDGATCELDRRLRESERRARDFDAAATQRRKRVRGHAVLIVLLLCAALGLGATLIMMLSL